MPSLFLPRYEEVAPLALGFNEGQINPRDLQTVLDKVTEFYGLDQDMREAHLTEEKVGKFVDILSGSFNEKKHKRFAKAKEILLRNFSLKTRNKLPFMFEQTCKTMAVSFQIPCSSMPLTSL